MCVVYTPLERREEEEVLKDEEGVKDGGIRKERGQYCFSLGHVSDWTYVEGGRCAC